MDSPDDIFLNAREMGDPTKRAAYLAQACGADAALRKRVEDLLRDADGAADFFGAEDNLPGAIATPLTEGPGTVIDRYKLLEKIGEGGMGVVYMAEQREPVTRKVALKIIKLGMDTRQVLGRFEAERQALALMDHPNIAKILDGGATDTGRPYFVMDLVQGLPITRFCDEANLSTRERLDLFLDVCSAIQHAHQKGIIHRDIKPANILVTLHGDKPVPKVIDFGVSKATQGRLTEKTLFTQFQHFIGTPAYMSPEQTSLSGLDVDTRSDIYGLGVLLYELLTGKTPFDAKELLASGIDAMRKTIREQEPVRPSTRLTQELGAASRQSAAGLAKENSGALTRRRYDRAKELISLLRGDLDWIVMKCLEKDRARRYETANDVVADLKRHLNNEPVVARPPSGAYRFQKAFRRNKLAFTAATVVAVTLIGGLGLSTWSFLRERKAHAGEAAQRRTAVEQQKKAEAAQGREAEQRGKAEALLYAAKINLARQAWEKNNMGRLRQLLAETEDSPDRGFEWYYWQRQAHPAVKTLRGHLQSVMAVAFSPDGQRIVTGSDDKTAKVWEAASGRELFTLKGHSAGIESAAFSPDGQRILTGSHDHTARVWEAASGNHLLTLKGHNDAIRSVAFSPDGQRIVTCSQDNDKTARVWDAASGQELLMLNGHYHWFGSVAFSPDGQRIVTGSDDHTAIVWDAASGRELLKLKGHHSRVWSAAFSPDGRRIVTGSWDKTAKIWDAASGREVVTLEGHNRQVMSVAFSGDGQRIVTGSEDHTAKVWDAASGQELLTFRGHNDQIWAVAFSLDGQRIVTGGYDKTAKVWDTADDRELTLKGHSLGRSAAFDYADSVGSIWSAAFSPDGQRIVTASKDQTAKVWDAASGRELFTFTGHNNVIFSVAFSPDGKRIVTGSEDHTAKVWDAHSGRELHTLKEHKDRIWCVAFSPDGQRILTGSKDQTAKVWDTLSGRPLLTLEGHSAGINSVAFSPDGQQILSGSDDRTAKVWDAASGHQLRTLKEHSAPIRSVAFSPDGRRIVTGSGDGTAKVWDAASGRELFALVGHKAGHRDWIWCVAFSPDGQRIVTGGDDGTARVWEAVDGRELLTLKGHSSAINSAVFSPDGQRILTASDDQTARIWRAARLEDVAAWKEEERTASQYMAALQQERNVEEERDRIVRSRDEGAIRRWLILAPVPLASGQSGAEGVETEQIEGESQLQPKAGEAKFIASSELKWQEVALEDYVIDFNAILRHQGSFSVAYAVCYLQSESEQRGLRMRVGSDDGSKVYLNGKQVYKFATDRTFVADEDTVPDIVLNAGRNVLVFKVAKEAGVLAVWWDTSDWKGSIRFTDAQGNPVKGINVTLRP